MTNSYRFVVVDLFCGGGGFTTGFVEAFIDDHRAIIAEETGLDPADVHRTHPAVVDWLDANLKLVAVNHWDPAVETYRTNHPYAEVYNAKVQALHPPDAVDGQRVNALIAGPSCIPHSPAKGGMASDDQKRMSPRHVAHWLDLLRPDQFLLENVPGFRRWGPLEYPDDGGEPSMVKDGSCFEDWLRTLRTQGYTVAHETFTAADYGDLQARDRLFVMGRLNYEPAWPTPTHSADGAGDTEPHRPAADIIDWSDRGMSIWTRDIDHPRVHTPPAAKTLRRIAEGIRRHCDDALDPFADVLAELDREGIRTLRDDPVDAADLPDAATDRDEPFLVRGPAVTPADADGRLGLCLPYVLGQHSNAVARSIEEALPTVTTSGSIGLIEPQAFVLPRDGKQRDEFSNPTYEPDDRPLHTVTANNHDGRLVSPSLVIYNGQSDVAAVDDPLPTVTATERHALAVPDLLPWGLDIGFRMLQPPELKRAQGFPNGYELPVDAKKRKTKLIGNAVPVALAKALCRTLLRPTAKPTLNNYAEGPQPVADGGVADDD
ncbi:DNA cytosine methyltransferase [Haloarcula sp. JP-L23]|uniref:DNA cytosine methyltransferase n=1 Tax=Haloarcula sp. JP-L23 TaxID=2716717 RepID=UPI00140F48A0|nr:DNA methyltransferase [Haloarcula sp. JP-L23]